MDAWCKVTLCLLWINSAMASPVRHPRLSLAAQAPNYFYRGSDGTYTFGYDVLDPESGNTQFRTEERYSNGTVVGSYGYIDALGKSRRYDYIADEKGYRVVSAKLQQEPYIAPPVNVIEEPSTEATVAWTRPPKRKGVKKVFNPAIERRIFNSYQPLTHYLLY
ncbi:pupal cuticle protein Edg-84A-like [Zerene cesonia]|uniref:pupal cuticle protein Edg-84A-like n=1 Tax=Zerene cesonia TaxID=33412 RepID=UPI0018E595EA|nr:pupal cuticle protein Edg-84A-like [Zerene cesonia]